MDIRNKVDIITIASADIGLATIKVFTKNDAKVALASHHYLPPLIQKSMNL